MPEPTVESYGSYLVGATGQESADLPPPSGVTASSVVLGAFLKQNTAAVNVPPGWTLIDPDSLGYTVAVPSGGQFHRVYLYWHRGVPSSYNFTWTGGTWRAGKALRIEGAQSSGNPFRTGTGTAFTTATSANSVPVSYTGFVIDDLGLYILSHYQGIATFDLVNATPENDWTSQSIGDGSNRDLAFASKPRTVNGDLIDFVVPTGRVSTTTATLLAVMPQAAALIEAAAALSASTVLTAGATRGIPAGTSLTAEATVTAEAVVTVHAAVGLSANAMLGVSSELSRPGAVALSASTQVMADAVVDRAAAVALAASTALTAAGVTEPVGGIALSASTVLSATAVRELAGLVALASTTTLTLAATGTVLGAVALVASTMLSAVPTGAAGAPGSLTASNRPEAAMSATDAASLTVSNRPQWGAL